MLALLPAMARLSLVLADTARGPLLRAERQNCVLSIVERGGGGGVAGGGVVGHCICVGRSLCPGKLLVDEIRSYHCSARHAAALFPEASLRVGCFIPSHH